MMLYLVNSGGVVALNVLLHRSLPYVAPMGVQSSRHQAVLEELSEWWEDITGARIGSRVVLVEVPPGWGATTVLREFKAKVADPDAPVAISVSLDEMPLAGPAVEAKALSDALLAPLGRSRLARLFGLNTAAGKAGLALGVGGLFVSGMPTQVSLLLASLGATGAQNAWDASPAGKEGVLARAARAVAAVSAEVPVAVLVDNADRFDVNMMALMIDNLASRLNGHVLVVAAVHPGSQLAAELRAPDRYGLAGRVVRAEADPDMSAASRTALARELRPGLPDDAIERIGQRTASFAEVFTIAGEEKLTDAMSVDAPAAVRIVDRVIDEVPARSTRSAQVRVLAWAGGALTERQADRALAILGEPSDPDDPEVIRAGGLARLRDPASSHVPGQADLLATSAKSVLAAAVLAEAAAIARDPDATLIERTVARLAAHRIRADLDPSAELTKVQCLLIRGLEQLGDPEAAYQVAEDALDELAEDPQNASQRADLIKARLRLIRTRPETADDPLTQEAINLASTSGALFGTEARVWAAVNLLRRPGPREAALSLVDQITTDLGTYPSRDQTVNQWRLLLAFHAGQAGYPATAQQLIAPIISGGTTEQQDAARAVLRALDGPRSDIRLQIIILETELHATPATADEDRLRLHHALAWDYGQLGSYTRALQHATEELSYRRRLQRPDHPDVLTTRANIAFWTGQCGDAAAALRLYRELLPDRVRVLGPDHPDVLTTRGNIAQLTGECGDAAAALRLYRELLPDRVRILGPDHPHVLTARANIAFWTGQRGDAAAALQLYRELLPDEVRVLGPDHPDVLTTRGNIAQWTGQHGDAAAALRLARELLPDQLRIQGPDHPDVLTTRANIGRWTGQCGDAAAALQLYRELLPDQVRVLGPDHPDVLTTRANIGRWTGQCGDAAAALQLFRELLPDQLRVLGPDHPDVLTTRANIGRWTGQCGDAAAALRLFRELLPDQLRVLGPDHPDVLTTRANIGRWTGQCGDAAAALRLYRELLPDQVRVLGPDHPDVLTTRANIGRWTGQCGDAAAALQLYRQLLPDQVRVLGPDHPDVLTTRNNIAYLTSQDGHAAAALQLYRELLPDQVRILGPDHPDVLTTRNNIAYLTSQDGHAAAALQLYRELLPDQVRILGPDHPDVLTTRANVAAWTSECGDAATALQLYRELLADMVRVLGPDHPDTLTIRNNVAALTTRSGGDAGHEPEADPDGPEGENETGGS